MKVNKKKIDISLGELLTLLSIIGSVVFGGFALGGKWHNLATKDDIQSLDSRLSRIEGRLGIGAISSDVDKKKASYSQIN